MRKASSDRVLALWEGWIQRVFIVKKAGKKDHLLSLFHHIHHKDGEHEVHHCGGEHKNLPYTIEHCPCGKHKIDMREAEGHGTERGDDLLSVMVEFKEKCPEGGWHIESGKIIE